MLWRVFFERWRKETEISKKNLWGGRFGRLQLCPGRAEQDSHDRPMPGDYLSTETNLVPIRGVMRKEFFRQTRTCNKAPWAARSTAVHVTLGKYNPKLLITLCSSSQYQVVKQKKGPTRVTCSQTLHGDCDFFFS